MKFCLAPFQIASRAVTNREYLEFMADNGYRRPELWLSDGWDQVCAQGWGSPFYWDKHDDNTWWHFANDGMKPVDLAEPVCHVSYYEADAYAHWAGARLPTEAEWEVAAVRLPREVLCWRTKSFIHKPATGRAFNKRLAMCGSGQRVHIRHIRGSRQLPAQWASITANSCAISLFYEAVLA